MGALSTILGTKGVVNGLLKTVDQFIDTPAEKADAKKTIMESYAPFKIAQRVLAIMFATTYCVAFFATLSLRLYADLDGDTVIETVEAYRVGWIMLTIVGFYFGGGAFEGGANAIRKRREQKAPVKKDDDDDTPNRPGRPEP